MLIHLNLQVIMLLEQNWENTHLRINTDVKLVKYWHRLEYLSGDSILKEAYTLCKRNSHSWFSNIIKCLYKNGLNYISEKP